MDPLAAATKSFSSYAAMNNNPASTVDPLGLTGIGIISWVDYAPTRMDQLLMLSPAQMMDQLGITDELRNYNEQMVAAAREREQMRETRQQAAIQAWTGQSPFSSGNTACNKFLTDGPSANEVYGVGGGSSDGDTPNDGDGDGKKKVTMKSADEYDYSQDVIPGKQAEDLDYIKNGEDGNMLTRWFKTIKRDWNANDNVAAQDIADVSELVAAVPLVRIGKMLVPKGFREVKGFGYQHGQKVFEYNGKYYSKDLDGHNGGVWKVFEERGGKLRRIGTADENLNIFKK